MVDLLFPETDHELIKYETILFKILNISFDGVWIRKPKIIIMVDDASGTSLFTNITHNKFYKMLTR